MRSNPPAIEWRTLDIRGATGPIDNNYLVHGASRIAVVFPGFMGGWTTPATYYPALALLDRGFDALCLDSIYREHPPIKTLKTDAAAALMAAQTAGTYERTLVMGKSLGTIAMAELLNDGTLSPSTQTIWLTPLLKDQATWRAISSLKTPALVVIGTDDPHYDEGALDSLKTVGHRAVTVERANHGLAVDGDALASAEVPRRLVAAVHDYVERD